MNDAITCLIPTYNGQHLLAKHLPAVLTSLRDGDQLLICDDASTDNTIDWLSNEFQLQPQTDWQTGDVPNNYQPQPQPSSHQVLVGSYRSKNKQIEMTVLVNRTNQRFAATVNAGMCLAQQQQVLLLNNDVSPESTTRDVLTEQMTSDEGIFAIGCLEYETDQQGDKSGKNSLWFERGLFQHSKADDFQSGPTAWASGGSAMFSRPKWLVLGGFDLAFYPAYWEDVDLSYRARQKGWQVLFNQEAVVYHQHETTNAVALGPETMTSVSWNNGLKFTWKHANTWQKLQFLLWQPYWWYQRWKVMR